MTLFRRRQPRTSFLSRWMRATDLTFLEMFRKQYAMSEALERLTKSVDHLTDLVGTAAASLTSSAAALRDALAKVENNDDAAALNALADKLDADAAAISAALPPTTAAAADATASDPAPAVTADAGGTLGDAGTTSTAAVDPADGVRAADGSTQEP